MITEKTPAGIPARSRQFGHGQGGERRFRCGLADEGAASGERRAGLAGDHGIGEIPRGDRRDDADRLLITTMRPFGQGEGMVSP